MIRTGLRRRPDSVLGQFVAVKSKVCQNCKRKDGEPVVKSDHRNTLAVGFDSSMNGGISRNSARNAAFLIQPPVLAARMGGLIPCRLASAVPGLSTRSSRRPHLTVSAPVLNQNWQEVV